MLYSVIVPVRDSAASVVELVERTQAVFASIGEESEVILVDDGSTDPESWQTLRSLAREHPNVRSIRLMRNYGKAHAVLCGLEAATGNWMITIDDDLQQRPEDIPALIEHRDHDVVVARFKKRRHGGLTVLTSALKSRFDRWILGVPCKMTPLKLFSAKIAEAMLANRSARPFIPALLARATADFFPVDVSHEPSSVPRSRYTFRGRVAKFADLLIGNSPLLPQALGWTGLSTAAAGLLLGGVLGYRHLAQSVPVPGWSALLAANLLVGGLLLAGLGLIGDYLYRVLQQVTPGPSFVIRETCGFASSDPMGGSGAPDGSEASPRAAGSPRAARSSRPA